METIVDIKRNGVHAQSAKIQALCTNTYRRRGRTIGNGRMIKRLRQITEVEGRRGRTKGLDMLSRLQALMLLDAQQAWSLLP